MNLFSAALCLLPPSSRKPIVPQKEPSPLLEKKIQQLEAKFAELEGGDEDMEEMGEEEGDMTETPSMPQLQAPLASDLDIMPYTPPQVRTLLQEPLNLDIPLSFPNPNKESNILSYTKKVFMLKFTSVWSKLHKKMLACAICYPGDSFIPLKYF